MRGISSSGGYRHFLTIRSHEGDERKLSVPQSLYDYATPGNLSIQRALLLQTGHTGFPVAVILTKKPNTPDSPLVKPGSMLDQLIHPPGSEGEPGNPDPEPAENFSLLMPWIGAIAGGLFTWTIAGYLIYKLPRATRSWPMLATGLVLALAGGIWWSVAG